MNRMLSLPISTVLVFSLFGFGCNSQLSGEGESARFSSNNATARVSGEADSADGGEVGNDVDANGALGGGGADEDDGSGVGTGSDAGEDGLGMGGNGSEDLGGVGLEEIEEEFNSQCDFFDKEYKMEMQSVEIEGGPPVGIDLSKYTLGRSGKFEGGDYKFSIKVYIVGGRYYTDLDDSPRNSKFTTKRYEAVIENARLPSCEVYARSEGDSDDVRQGCFLSTTKITMADRSQKLVSKIERGDRVYNPVLNKSFVVTEIVRGFEKEAGLIEVGIGENIVSVTSTHPFLTRTGIKQAQELTKYDAIVTPDGQYVRIQHLKHLPVDPTVQVANLTIGGDTGDVYQHMVLADGIISGDLFLQNSTEKLRQQAPSQMFSLQY